MSAGSGPAPAALVFYNYLYFDGTAFIETDLYMPPGGSIRVSLGKESVKGQQGLFLQKNSSNVSTVGAWYNSNTTGTKRTFGIRYQNTGSSTAYSLNWSTDTYNFFMTQKKYGWDSTAYNVTKGSVASTVPMCIGAVQNGSAYTGRMGTFYMYDSTTQNVASYDGFDTYTPTYTLRPCTYRGFAGLWCVETGTFYGNTAGAGTLRASDS